MYVGRYIFGIYSIYGAITSFRQMSGRLLVIPAAIDAQCLGSLAH